MVQEPSGPCPWMDFRAQRLFISWTSRGLVVVTPDGMLGDHNNAMLEHEP
jgi:hypothetical protein